MYPQKSIPCMPTKPRKSDQLLFDNKNLNHVRQTEFRHEWCNWNKIANFGLEMSRPKRNFELGIFWCCLPRIPVSLLKLLIFSFKGAFLSLPHWLDTWLRLPNHSTPSPEYNDKSSLVTSLMTAFLHKLFHLPGTCALTLPSPLCLCLISTHSLCLSNITSSSKNSSEGTLGFLLLFYIQQVLSPYFSGDYFRFQLKKLPVFCHF